KLKSSFVVKKLEQFHFGNCENSTNENNIVTNNNNGENKEQNEPNQKKRKIEQIINIPDGDKRRFILNILKQMGLLNSHLNTTFYSEHFYLLFILLNGKMFFINHTDIERIKRPTLSAKNEQNNKQQNEEEEKEERVTNERKQHSEKVEDEETMLSVPSSVKTVNNKRNNNENKENEINRRNVPKNPLNALTGLDSEDSILKKEDEDDNMSTTQIDDNDLQEVEALFKEHLENRKLVHQQIVADHNNTNELNTSNVSVTPSSHNNNNTNEIPYLAFTFSYITVRFYHLIDNWKPPQIQDSKNNSENTTNLTVEQKIDYSYFMLDNCLTQCLKVLKPLRQIGRILNICFGKMEDIEEENNEQNIINEYKEILVDKIKKYDNFLQEEVNNRLLLKFPFLEKRSSQHQQIWFPKWFQPEDEEIYYHRLTKLSQLQSSVFLNSDNNHVHKLRTKLQQSEIILTKDMQKHLSIFNYSENKKKPTEQQLRDLERKIEELKNTQQALLLDNIVLASSFKLE
ncbi:hypothetical protein ABK040_016170, partial [Willaertia magna]